MLVKVGVDSCCSVERNKQLLLLLLVSRVATMFICSTRVSVEVCVSIRGVKL